KAKLADLYMLDSNQTQRQDRKAQDMDSARELAQKLVDQDPNSFDGHRILGEIALNQKDTATAITEFQAANQSKPLEPEVVINYFKALVMSNRTQEAEKLAYQLIDKDK